MKLTTTLAISDHNKSYQVTAELELNYQTDAQIVSNGFLNFSKESKIR